MVSSEKIFNINSKKEFESLAIEIFKYQAKKNLVYNKYITSLGIDFMNIDELEKIPFLPINFFKSQQIISSKNNIDKVFFSSGTSGLRSKHYVFDLNLYEKSLIKSFEYFYGNIKNYTFYALIPSIQSLNESSLVYMTKKFIQLSENANSNFYFNDYNNLFKKLSSNQNKKTILIGLGFALLDFCKKFPLKLNNTIVIETGGMKNINKEMHKVELHQILKKKFNTNQIHSEYGMTELLSQSYSKKNGKFKSPPWKKVQCRDITDPLSTNKNSGAINIIDLANYHSCSFIATNDLGKINNDNTFEILGRLQESDIRGCNQILDQIT